MEAYEYMNTTALAYMGDAVYELYVRKYVFASGEVNADCLHQRSVKYVRAEAQAEAIKKMLPDLEEVESALVKRARNRKTTSKPKNVDPIIYKWATAFEAFVGYLYLSGQDKRLEEIIKNAIDCIEETKGNHGRSGHE